MAAAAPFKSPFRVEFDTFELTDEEINDFIQKIEFLCEAFNLEMLSKPDIRLLRNEQKFRVVFKNGEQANTFKTKVIPHILAKIKKPFWDKVSYSNPCKIDPLEPSLDYLQYYIDMDDAETITKLLTEDQGYLDKIYRSWDELGLFYLIYTYLAYAIVNNKDEAFFAMLPFSKFLIHKEHEFGTLLHLAIENNKSKKMIETLLKDRPILISECTDGLKNRRGTINLVFENIKTKETFELFFDKLKITEALSLAFEKKNNAAIKAVIEYAEKKDPKLQISHELLSHAIDSGRIDIFEETLEKDPKLWDSDFFASYKGIYQAIFSQTPHPKIVETLLKHSIKKNSPEEINYGSPLYQQVAKMARTHDALNDPNNKIILQMLVNAGLDPLEPSPRNNKTPLSIAPNDEVREILTQHLIRRDTLFILAAFEELVPEKDHPREEIIEHKDGTKTISCFMFPPEHTMETLERISRDAYLHR